MLACLALMGTLGLVWPMVAAAQRHDARLEHSGHPSQHPYWYDHIDHLTASVRVDVQPTDAEVYVDGYRAGTVDDFDGIWQRLRLRAGAHDVVVYHPRFRTVVEHLYLNRGADVRLRFTMEPLAAGETAAVPPPPSEYAREAREAVEPARPPEREAREPAQPPVRLGAISLSVQPPDAEILIDGERWTGQPDRGRYFIRVPVGRHRLEISKPGLAPYAEDVLIQPGRTLSLNVVLR